MTRRAIARSLPNVVAIPVVGFDANKTLERKQVSQPRNWLQENSTKKLLCWDRRRTDSIQGPRSETSPNGRWMFLHPQTVPVRALHILWCVVSNLLGIKKIYTKDHPQTPLTKMRTTITLGIVALIYLSSLLLADAKKTSFAPLTFQPRSRHCLVTQNCLSYPLTTVEVLRGGASKKTTDEVDDDDNDKGEEQYYDEDSDIEVSGGMTFGTNFFQTSEYSWQFCDCSRM